MSTFLVTFLVMAVVNWVLLMIVVPIAQRLTDGTMLLWGEAWWKLAVVAATITVISVFLRPFGFVGWIAEGAVLWLLMWKWFDTEWLGVVIIVLGKGILGILAMFALMALLFR